MMEGFLNHLLLVRPIGKYRETRDKLMVLVQLNNNHIPGPPGPCCIC